MNGRVMVPLRAIFESLGAEVDWDANTRTITGTKGDTIVTLVVNSPTATVNGKEIVLDVPPVIIDGRTLVPVRFVSESLGAEVEWDGNRRQVNIATGTEIGELKVYFFVYNSERADASDLNAIRRYVSNFHDTYNVLFDAAGYRTAADLYDALRAE